MFRQFTDQLSGIQNDENYCLSCESVFHITARRFQCKLCLKRLCDKCCCVVTGSTNVSTTNLQVSSQNKTDRFCDVCSNVLCKDGSHVKSTIINKRNLQFPYAREIVCCVQSLDLFNSNQLQPKAVFSHLSFCLNIYCGNNLVYTISPMSRCIGQHFSILLDPSLPWSSCLVFEIVNTTRKGFEFVGRGRVSLKCVSLSSATAVSALLKSQENNNNHGYGTNSCCPEDLFCKIYFNRSLASYFQLPQSNSIGNNNCCILRLSLKLVQSSSLSHSPIIHHDDSMFVSNDKCQQFQKSQSTHQIKIINRLNEIFPGCSTMCTNIQQQMQLILIERGKVNDDLVDDRATLCNTNGNDLITISSTRFCYNLDLIAILDPQSYLFQLLYSSLQPLHKTKVKMDSIISNNGDDSKSNAMITPETTTTTTSAATDESKFKSASLVNNNNSNQGKAKSSNYGYKMFSLRNVFGSSGSSSSSSKTIPTSPSVVSNNSPIAHSSTKGQSVSLLHTEDSNSDRVVVALNGDDVDDDEFGIENNDECKSTKPIASRHHGAIFYPPQEALIHVLVGRDNNTPSSATTNSSSSWVYFNAGTDANNINITWKCYGALILTTHRLVFFPVHMLGCRQNSNNTKSNSSKTNSNSESKGKKNKKCDRSRFSVLKSYPFELPLHSISNMYIRHRSFSVIASTIAAAGGSTTVANGKTSTSASSFVDSNNSSSSTVSYISLDLCNALDGIVYSFMVLDDSIISSHNKENNRAPLSPIRSATAHTKHVVLQDINQTGTSSSDSEGSSYIYTVIQETRWMRESILWLKLECQQACYSSSNNRDIASSKDDNTVKHNDVDADNIMFSEFKRFGINTASLSNNDATTHTTTDDEQLQQQSFWRLSKLNDSYALCDSYPRLLAVPASVTDKTLSVAARHRSTQRLPVLTWLHPTTRAALFRSSQPNLGITDAACPEDEQLVLAIRDSVIAAAVAKYHANMNAVNTKTVKDLITVLRNDNALEMDKGPSNSISDGDNNNHDNADTNNNNQSNIAFGEHSWTNISSSATATFVKHSLEQQENINQQQQSIPYLSKQKQSPHLPQNIYSPSGLSSTSLSPSSVHLRILDCRPVISAHGNTLMGKGFENMSRLGGKDVATIQFANIQNIHVMRESYITLRTQLLKLCQSDQALAMEGTGNSNNNNNSDNSSNVAAIDVSANHFLNTDTSGYIQALHDSKWLQHLSDLLRASSYIADQLSLGNPCLIHCSDGWDRTSQVSALSQILLDPYYRTTHGLKTLIEKDFIHFGHKFKLRLGTCVSAESVMSATEDMISNYTADSTENNKRHKESSPVFLQFLDCLYQIWRQNVTAFEYNVNLIEFLAVAYRSGYSMDFSCDSIKEREYNQQQLLKQQSVNFAMRMNSSTAASLVPSTSSSSSSFPSVGLTQQLQSLSVWDVIENNLSSFQNILCIHPRQQQQHQQPPQHVERIYVSTLGSSLELWDIHFLGLYFPFSSSALSSSSYSSKNHTSSTTCMSPDNNNHVHTQYQQQQQQQYHQQQQFDPKGTNSLLTALQNSLWSKEQEICNLRQQIEYLSKSEGGNRNQMRKNCNGNDNCQSNHQNNNNINDNIHTDHANTVNTKNTTTTSHLRDHQKEATPIVATTALNIENFNNNHSNNVNSNVNSNGSNSNKDGGDGCDHKSNNGNSDNSSTAFTFNSVLVDDYIKIGL